jgi:predicted phosphate transport protein (TIGR00153 family)
MKPITDGPGITTTSEGGLEIRVVVSMLQWFRWLMPRQEMFFPLFERHAEVTLKAARALRQMLDGGGELDRRCQDVTAYEQAADEITREVLVGIRTSFITPFDRADIRHLITSMDDTIDQMQQTAKSIILFKMTTFDSEMRAIADVIVECAELVSGAMPLLSNVGENAASLNDICIQITRAEGRADEIHDRGLKSLYQKAKAGDPMDFVRGNQIYEHLEESVDRLDDVANEIQGVVIEHV